MPKNSSKTSKLSCYAVIVSDNAQADILAIARYIKNELHNDAAACKFIDDTCDAEDSLKSYPYIHEVRSTGILSDAEVRQYNYRKNYCMFYAVKEDEKLVKIIRVVYTGRNLNRIIHDFEVQNDQHRPPSPHSQLEMCLKSKNYILAIIYLYRISSIITITIVLTNTCKIAEIQRCQSTPPTPKTPRFRWTTSETPTDCSISPKTVPCSSPGTAGSPEC